MQELLKSSSNTHFSIYKTFTSVSKTTLLIHTCIGVYLCLYCSRPHVPQYTLAYKIILTYTYQSSHSRSTKQRHQLTPSHRIEAMKNLLYPKLYNIRRINITHRIPIYSHIIAQYNTFSAKRVRADGKALKTHIYIYDALIYIRGRKPRGQLVRIEIIIKRRARACALSAIFSVCLIYKQACVVPIQPRRAVL